MLTAPVFKWMMMGRQGPSVKKTRCSEHQFWWWEPRPTEVGRGSALEGVRRVLCGRWTHHQAHAGASVL